MSSKTNNSKPQIKVIRNEERKDDENQMPKPMTQNYEDEFIIKDQFVNEVHSALQTLPYADVAPMFNVLDSIMTNNNGIMKAGLLTEFLRRLSNFPFINVARVMSLVSNPQMRENMYVPKNAPSQEPTAEMRNDSTSDDTMVKPTITLDGETETSAK